MEMEKRLSRTVGALRRGLADTRTLQASLKAEARELEAFIPVLVKGACSGINDALRQQVRPHTVSCAVPVVFLCHACTACRTNNRTACPGSCNAAKHSGDGHNQQSNAVTWKVQSL